MNHDMNTKAKEARPVMKLDVGGWKLFLDIVLASRGTDHVVVIRVYPGNRRVTTSQIFPMRRFIRAFSFCIQAG